jgi:hypothetical protein
VTRTPKGRYPWPSGAPRELHGSWTRRSSISNRSEIATPAIEPHASLHGTEHGDRSIAASRRSGVASRAGHASVARHARVRSMKRRPRRRALRRAVVVVRDERALLACRCAAAHTARIAGARSANATARRR